MIAGRRRGAFALTFALTAGAGCTFFFPSFDEYLGDGGSRAAPDADGLDGAMETTDAASVTYHAFDGAQYWETVDLTLVQPNLRGFAGAGFDGRFLYLAPTGGTNTVVPRFEAYAELHRATSWSTFDLRALGTQPLAYAGAVFDSRHLHFVSDTASGAVFARLDVGDFTDAGAWTPFDVAALDPVHSKHGFFGGAFDGHYLYFAPTGGAALAARYDTDAAAYDAGWSLFDLSTVEPGGAGEYAGAAFDGQFVYFAPASATHAARYDPSQSFDSRFGWTFAPLNPTVSCLGMVYDGHYLYYVPYTEGPAPSASGSVHRFDTTNTMGFTAPGSWQLFDVGTVNADAKGFAGGVFDGRYVYFVPYGPKAVAVRYDTQQDFGAPSSWSTFALVSLDPNAQNFVGAGFDGQYVYFVPRTQSILVRFDARTPSALPPTSRGSFL
jgi:hypothetical protein